jgi:hypothetical protein
MALSCEVLMKKSATPEQLSALGAALWGWCNQGAGGSAVFQYVNNQVLADLMAGKFPVSNHWSREASPLSLRFNVRGNTSRDFRPTVNSLRRDLPVLAIEDIVIDGVSWNLVD